MTPAQARAAHIRQIWQQGEVVAVRRISGTTTTEANTRARVTGYKPEELVGGIMQGDRKVILMPDELEAAGFPLPVLRGDKLVVRGRVLNVESVDDSTRRIGDELIAYEITARGS